MNDTVNKVMGVFVLVLMLAGIFCMCMAIYTAGYDNGQIDALNNKWWYEKTTTFDGTTRYQELYKAVQH